MSAVARSRVRIVYGTDVGVYPQGEAWREFISLVASGVTPLRALRAATSEAAALLGRDDLGSLTPGGTADVVALPGNPLDDIHVVSQVDFVMKEGKVALRPSKKEDPR